MQPISSVYIKFTKTALRHSTLKNISFMPRILNVDFHIFSTLYVGSPCTVEEVDSVAKTNVCKVHLKEIFYSTVAV